ncbi:MAG: hypothetical protein AAF366_10740 [Pseudomonadota bacterium]
MLRCPAIDEIDLSALTWLEANTTRLAEMDMTLHLSEVKGSVWTAYNAAISSMT